MKDDYISIELYNFFHKKEYSLGKISKMENLEDLRLIGASIEIRKKYCYSENGADHYTVEDLAGFLILRSWQAKCLNLEEDLFVTIEFDDEIFEKKGDKMHYDYEEFVGTGDGDSDVKMETEQKMLDKATLY